MITIDLNSDHEQRLRDLANAEGSDAVELARRILSDYVEFHATPAAPDEAWAEASVALAPEILPPDDWDNTEDNGS